MTAINSDLAPSVTMARSTATDDSPKSNASKTSPPLPSPARPMNATHGVGVATSVRQVERAWELVYQTYLTQGLINPNDHRIHTNFEAIHPTTSVVTQEEDGDVVSTLTIMQDRKRGLPLDCIYPAELGKLRSTGRRLLEIGLLAETVSKRGSSARGIIEMMRYVFWFAWHHKSFILAGVHPKHAGFYCRYFGFEQIGEPSTHPSVNHWPVVPLCCPLDVMLSQPPWPKGVSAFVQAPMPLDDFADRVRLTDEGLAQSRIGSYLEEKADQFAVRVA